MTRPLPGRMIIRLDEENRFVGKAGVLLAADEHSHKICEKCKMIDEALSDNPQCPGREPIFERDWKGRDQFRGMDTSHHVKVVTAPVITEPWRKATVVALGKDRIRDEDDDDEDFGGMQPSDFELGERVFVKADCGRPLPPDDVDSPFRVVFADAIALKVEEE